MEAPTRSPEASETAVVLVTGCTVLAQVLYQCRTQDPREGTRTRQSMLRGGWYKEPEEGGCKVARQGEAFYDTVYKPELVFVRVLEVRFSIEAFFTSKICCKN